MKKRLIVFFSIVIFIFSLISVSAKLNIVSYCDITLEACKNQDTGLALLEEKYPYDITVSYLYYFDTNDVESSRVHIALECANTQGMKEEYKVEIQNNLGDLTREALKEYAAAIYIDEGNFSFCLDTMITAPEVLEQVKHAEADGVTIVPTVRFNNDLYGGSQTFTSLHTLVREYLNIAEEETKKVAGSKEYEEITEEVPSEIAIEEAPEIEQEGIVEETAEEEPVFFRVIKQIRAWLLDVFQ